MTKHSPLGASGAERWMNCPGSVALIKELTLPESDEPEYRALGTAAHELACTMLTTGREAWEFVGSKAENGVKFTAEMCIHVNTYADWCRSLIQPDSIVLVEYGISSPSHKDFYGTLDCAVINGKTAYVNDMKYGEGVLVEVEDNPQVKYYGFGLLEAYPDVEEFVFTIVQPRGFHPDGPRRTWSLSADALSEWARSVLLPAMDGTEFNKALDAGDHCRFCPAKLVCPLVVSLFRAAAVADPKRVRTLDARTLGEDYRLTKAVKFYLKALEDETMRRWVSGEKVPHTKFVEKKANRVFKPGAEAIFTGALGADAYEPKSLRSPAQMELVSSLAKKLVHEWAYTPNTGYTIALAEDKRPAVAPPDPTDMLAAALDFVGA